MIDMSISSFNNDANSAWDINPKYGSALIRTSLLQTVLLQGYPSMYGDVSAKMASWI